MVLEHEVARKRQERVIVVVEFGGEPAPPTHAVGHEVFPFCGKI